MALSDFHTQISEEINQGTRLDSFIPAYVKRAARLIEQNYTFITMERFAEVELDVDQPNPRFLSWPEEDGLTNIKALDFIRYLTNSNSSTADKYTYIVPVEPTQIKTVESTNPLGYWLTGSPDGKGYIVLDNVPAQDMTLEMKWKAYSAWPTDYSSTPHLLRNCEMLLLSQTMILMSPLAEEPDWETRYANIWKMSLTAAINADQELRNSGVAEGYFTIPT